MQADNFEKMGQTFKSILEAVRQSNPNFGEAIDLMRKGCAEILEENRAKGAEHFESEIDQMEKMLEKIQGLKKEIRVELYPKEGPSKEVSLSMRELRKLINENEFKTLIILPRERETE
tara:strand:- start:439 stop:792 length:354 start_codon:yes stop_codon:yes gene_type:complete